MFVDKRLVGSNTDGEGFLRAIRSEFSVDLRDLRVMIIGAGGGTGRAIAWQCALENCERLVLVNRTLEKANAFAERLRPFFMEPRVLGPAARLEAVAWEESAMRMQLADIDLIVNATPLGMNPSDPAPVPAPLACAASHGFRLRVRAIENRSASRSRTSRRAQRERNIDVATSRCALVFHLVRSRGAD